MRFGLLYDFRNPARWRRSPDVLYREVLDEIASLEDLGYDSVWLTEHHFVEDGYLPSIFPLAGAIAERTTRLSIGTYVLLLPLHHPVEIAESAAVADVLSGGRFILGVGQGYRGEEFRGFGVPKAARGSLMEEALEIVWRCWNEQTFSHSGPHFQLQDVSAEPKPLQGHAMRLWIGAHTEKAIDRAARLGNGWLAAGAGRAEFDQYRTSCARSGRPLGAICALRNVWVGDRAAVAPYADYVRDNYRRWYRSAADRAVDASDESFTTTWQLMGEPSSVVEQIEAYHEEVPFGELVMLVRLAGMPDEMSRQSLRIFADEVLPRFK